MLKSHPATPLRGWPGGPSSLARVPIPSNIAPHLTMCRREAAVAQLDPLHAPDTGMLPFVVSMSNIAKLPMTYYGRFLMS